MREEIRHKNVLEEYVVEKYGSVKNFVSRVEKAKELRYDGENLESTIKSPNFLKAMQLGMKVCGGLKIDFLELFGNQNIRASDFADNLNIEKAAEEKYLLLNSAARQKTLEYINDILNN